VFDARNDIVQVDVLETLRLPATESQQLVD
jgi:hypothetical protein